MPPDLEVIHEWLVSAERDLDGARHLRHGPRPLVELVLFHCQQAVEKLLKAYLEFKLQRPPKTHALGQLFDLAKTQDVNFASIEEADWLSPYAIAGRYPGSNLAATAEIADEGIRAAAAVQQFVTDRQPDEVRP